MDEITNIFPSPAEIEAARRQNLAFHSEATRAGLFAAALDMATTMKEANVPEGQAALVTGAVEFAVQLWLGIMVQAGHTPADARRAFDKESRLFFNKYRDPVKLETEQ